MARFPAGTTGSQLDALARYVPVLRAGEEARLRSRHRPRRPQPAVVHEGPHRISKMANDIALQPGMIVGDEQAAADAYGIRMENLVAVREAKIDGADRRYLEFETLTLAAVKDLACIEAGLLTDAGGNGSTIITTTCATVKFEMSGRAGVASPKQRTI